jgi:hypothetical protein
MNVKVLDKLESGYIKLTWIEYINRANLKSSDLEKIVDIIDNFKNKHTTKELVIFKLKIVPVYVTIKKQDYISILEWIKNKFIELEMYEKCERIVNLIKVL